MIFILGGSSLLETKAVPSIWEQQLLVSTSNFLHISLKINVYLGQVMKVGVTNVIWFFYQIMSKPGNETGPPSWPDPFFFKFWSEPANISLLLNTGSRVLLSMRWTATVVDLFQLHLSEPCPTQRTGVVPLQWISWVSAETERAGWRWEMAGGSRDVWTEWVGEKIILIYEI